MRYQYIRTEFDKNIAIVYINRPPLNALNTQILHELLSEIDELEARTEISAIVITGGGEKSFVAGNDLIQLQQFNSVGLNELTTISRAAFTRIERVSKPIVAAINGLALDSGLELALACDYIVCSENARFAFPVIDKMNTGGVKTKRMQNVLCKEELVKKVLYHGKVFSAKTALELEIVDTIVSGNDLLTVAKEWALNHSLRDAI